MTALKSFNPDGFQFAWDSTSIGTFVTCPRKYYFSMLQGWTNPNKSVHLIFGGHYASALEHFHKHRAAGVGYAEAVRLVVREVLENTWDREAGAPQDWGHNTKTRDTLIRSVVWYLEHFKDDPMETVILSDGRAAVEYSFSLELSTDYLYCGHIDRLVTYGDGKDIYVQDQKTTGSSITPHFFSGYSPDYQMTGYTWAGQIIFNMPVKGVVIDAAHIAVGFTAFGRQPVTRSAKQLEEFRAEVLHYIGAAKACHESGFYPMNRTACGNYGGCEFRRICSAVPGVRSNLLEGEFKKRDRWDPLERR
jgi:hypothetical protein